MIIHVCDVCGKRMDDFDSWKRQSGKMVTVELCEKCEKDLEAFLNGERKLEASPPPIRGPVNQIFTLSDH